MAMENRINNLEQTNSPKVLVFEEDPAHLDALCMALSLYNYDCLKADCNAQAFEYLYETNENSVDLIVIDLSSPKMIGLEAIRLCHLARPDIPIVVLTSHDSAENEAAAREKGADYFLTKEGTPGLHLIDVIHATIRRH